MPCSALAFSHFFLCTSLMHVCILSLPMPYPHSSVSTVLWAPVFRRHNLTTESSGLCESILGSLWNTFVCFLFFSLRNLFLMCPLQESLSQAAALLLRHPGLCPVWGHGAFLFDGGVPHPVCYVTASGPSHGFHHSVSSPGWVCLLHQSVPDLQLNKSFSLNKLVSDSSFLTLCIAQCQGLGCP